MSSICLLTPPQPLHTTPTILSPTQLSFTVPMTPAFSHLILFLLPSTTLPPDSAASIYLKLPSAADFRFLGALSNDKASAIFKISGGKGGAAAAHRPDGEGDELMVDEIDAAPSNPTASTTSNGLGATGEEMVLGISIEPLATVTTQLEALALARQQRALSSSSSAISNGLQLVRSNPPPTPTLTPTFATNSALTTPTTTTTTTTPVSTKILAQRIIGNAFNFLASFASDAGGGNEVVPLKSFREWWDKFEKRMARDPGCLERADGQ